MDQENRIVVLIDMDCFYCQVEEKLNPDLQGKPIAVVQYNPWKGGGIIAVNYVARAMGVTRHMRGDEAKMKCPEIELPSVPCQRGKADITKYREAGKEVAKVLQKFTPLLERASIDEAYLDITANVQKKLQALNAHTLTSNMMPNTFALGYESLDKFISDVNSCHSECIDFDYEYAKSLLVGSWIVSEIRAAVYEETGYRCSAGIAHNKILAKLVCGMNKPNKQTLLPKHSINILYKTLSLKKVKHLGGKFGDAVCERLKIKTMAELQQFPEKELQVKFDEKNGTWLYNIARGIDLEPVQARFNPKSIGCCKQFRGKNALVDLESLRKWLNDLGEEIEDRLEKDALENNRVPKQMVVSFAVEHLDGRDVSSSRSYNFTPEDDLCGVLFSSKALDLLMDSAEGCQVKDRENNRKLKAPIKFLGISVGKFEDECKKTKKIKDYFTAGSSKDITRIVNTANANNNNQHKSNESRDCSLRNIFEKSIETMQSNQQNDHCKKDDNVNNIVIESTLDKQESFFAKFLNGGLDTGSGVKGLQDKVIETKVEVRSESHVSNNIYGEDNSNDTTYSGSTIDEEINKSIALFEEDPEDVLRVSNMRQLLNNSKVHNSENDAEVVERGVELPKSSVASTVSNFKNIETIECSECSKIIPLDMFDLHTDFHLALKIREEEKEEMRKEREKNAVIRPNNKDAQKKKQLLENIGKKSEGVPSIFNFLTKFDENVPSQICSECKRRVPVEKLLEHQDFHEAQKLSRELNNKTILNNSAESNNFKRKRKSASPVKKSKVPCKSIDLFFR